MTVSPPLPPARRHALVDRLRRVRLPGGAATQSILVPVLSVVTALLVGAVIILVSGGNPVRAYEGLYEGSIGCPGALSGDDGIQVTRLVCASSVTDTLVTATPFVIAGLAVAFAFKGGLFNIGVEGQLLAGSLAAVLAGYQIHGLPPVVHITVALAAGIAAGAAYGAIPGLLKAYTGAHEVIVTIMLNYVAGTMTSYFLSGAMKDPRSGAIARTPYIDQAARLPDIWPGPEALHLGALLAVLIAVGLWWVLQRTTIGYEVRTAGTNPHAARYAGMSVARTVALTMAVAGALAGLAGAIEVTGVNYYHTPGFSVGYGFDSIAIALLGRAHPIGVIPAALLFGALRGGASRMQFLTQIPVDIIQVIQALVLLFVAAPAIVRWLYRVRQQPQTVIEEQRPEPAATA